MSKAKFVIIDAYSLLYRAFFALPPLTNKQGEVTNAVYGFTSMLVKLLDNEQPEYLAVAFDMHALTFRHEAYDAYKAHRAPMPETLRPQIAMTREVLEVMRIPMLGVEGFEADDIIGTLAKRAEAKGYSVLIVTGDRDALQLVDEQIHVLATKRGITDTMEFDRQGVIDRYGVTPEQLPDMKALMGDSSDNIPGVPGIGEKTAGKLIAQYGTLENLFAHVEEVKGKVGAALATYTDQAYQSKELATIHLGVPFTDFSWENCRRQPWDQQRLAEVFQRLDFRTLLNRLTVQGSQSTIAPTPAVTEETPRPLRLLDDAAGITRLATRLRESGACILTPVAAGIDSLRDPLVGLAISAGADIDVYVPLQASPPAQTSLFGDDVVADTALTRQYLQPLFEVLADARVQKIGFDLKKLALWLRTQDVELKGLSFDVLLAAYLIDPTSRFTFADLCLDYLTLHVEPANFTELWRRGDMLTLLLALGQQQHNIRRLVTPLRQAISEYGLLSLFQEVEMPLIDVLVAMEWAGMAIDTRHLEELSDDFGKRIYQLERDIYQLAGVTFTINSPKQLQEVLFERLKLQKGRKTKTGYSTDATTLALLAEENEIVRKILSYRELSKLKSTYVDSLPRLINPRDGRLHSHFNQVGTSTGRISSNDPNLQNIPIRTAEGREIRQTFIPAQTGWVLLAADYSQIELRVLAHITQDEALTEVFRRGEDLHTATACRVFGVAADQVTREMRRMAKVVNFSIPYGTTAFGLARQLGSTREVAEDLKQTYLSRFPGIKRYMEEIVQSARREGIVTTLLGRRRPIPDLHTGAVTLRQAAERTAINTPIQGSAADIMKLAMLRLYRDLTQRTELHAQILLQVHDEMVLATPTSEVDALAELVRAAMVMAYPLTVPLEVEIKVGPNWRDVTPQIEELPITEAGMED